MQARISKHAQNLSLAQIAAVDRTGDVRQVADDYRISDVDAASQVLTHDALAAVQVIHEQKDSAYLGAEVIGDPEQYAIIRTSSRDAEHMEASLTAAGLGDASISIEYAERSLNDLTSALTILIETSPRPSFDGWIDERAAAIVLSGPSAPELKDWIDSSPALRPLTPWIRFESSPLAVTAATSYGGLAAGGLGCTTGYNVRRYGTGTRYLTTAGHCDADDAMTVSGCSLPLYLRNYSGSRDIQMHASSCLTESSKIRIVFTGPTEVEYRTMRSKRSRADQLVGDRVAKYGRCSSFTDGEIDSRVSAPNYVPNVQPVFIRSNDMHACRGDSGGPVFRSSAVLGTISGVGTNTSIWMATDYLESAGAGYIVRVSP
ncbi:MAG: S1 family peptidase [Chloroflexota bacterium]|nr:S1 family peptidase [Chloroflexota bacterium]